MIIDYLGLGLGLELGLSKKFMTFNIVSEF